MHGRCSLLVPNGEFFEKPLDAGDIVENFKEYLEAGGKQNTAVVSDNRELIENFVRNGKAATGTVVRLVTGIRHGNFVTDSFSWDYAVPVDCHGKLLKVLPKIEEIEKV